MEYAKHLQMSRLALMVIGIWPFKFENKSKLLQIGYLLYCKILHVYYFAALYCQCVQIFFLEEYNVDEVLENVGVSMLYTINLVKVAICSSKGAKHLIFQILETEKRMFSGIYIIFYYVVSTFVAFLALYSLIQK